VTDAPQDEAAGPDGGARIAQEMRLRPDRPRVTRLSRKVLIGLGGVVAVGIGGAVFFALEPNHQTASSELYNTDNRSTPDGLANLPRDYTGLPRNTPQLGPPLPGDLGRPIVNAGAPAPGMPKPAAPPDPEQQRIAQELAHQPSLRGHQYKAGRGGRRTGSIAGLRRNGGARHRRFERSHRAG
jgi:type IV secretion system protein VirB10